MSLTVFSGIMTSSDQQSNIVANIAASIAATVGRIGQRRDRNHRFQCASTGSPLARNWA